MSNSSDLPPDRNPVTTVDLIAVAAGDGDKALITRVHDAARASTLVAGQLAMFSRIVDAMRGDNLNEPSINALVAAKALGAQLHARRARADHRDRVVLPTLVETLFDRAAAIVLDWLRPDGTPAFAGLRDDRGADLLEVSADAAGFVIRCERTPAMDGITRLVGELVARDDTPLRARIMLLDARGGSAQWTHTDALGMFAIALTHDAREVVFAAYDVNGSAFTPVVLPLAPRELPPDRARESR